MNRSDGIALALGALFCGSLAAQENATLTFHGEVGLGVSRLSTVNAKAGDAFVGTAALKGTTGTLAIKGPSGTIVRTVTLDGGEQPVGFIAPIDGSYTADVTTGATGSASVTLRPSTPAERARRSFGPPTVRYESARIKQLTAAIEKGEPGALERFWADAKASNGPLIEPFAGDSEHLLVTFLWRETYETHNVTVSRPPEDFYLTRHPGTDVWYKTMKVHRNSRFQYTLVPNYLKEDAYQLGQLDPLNPRTFPDGLDRTDLAAASVLSLPGALDESWATSKPRQQGTLTDHKFESSSLKTTLDVAVFTPPGYTASSGKYPLIVLFDGPAYRRVAPTIVSNLVSARRIRPPVVCLVSSVTTNLPNRAANLNNNPAWARAIAGELVPWLRGKWAISGDPADLVVGGSSAGANAGLFIGLHHSAVFRNVLSIDGGAGRGSVLPQRFLEAPRVPLRIYMSHSLYSLRMAELPRDEMAEGMATIATGPRLRDILMAKGYAVISRDVYGSHDGLHFRAALADGLIALLGK